ncbi:hypothetical protein CBL_11539 [Carabus blaptoides fortunei]
MVRKKGSKVSAEINSDPPDLEMCDQEIQTDRSMDSFESCSSTTSITDAFASRNVGMQTDPCPLSVSSCSASTSITSIDLVQYPSEYRIAIEDDTYLETTQPAKKCSRFMSVWKLIRWYLLLAIIYGTVCYILQYYSVKHTRDDAT